MKSDHDLKMPLFVLILSIFSLTLILSSAQGQINKTSEDLYPGLASDSLQWATTAKLPKGTLLTAGSLIIKESELTRAISQSEPVVRKQLAKNAFFLLENIATKRLLLQEAYQAGHKKGGDEDQVIMNFVSEKIKIAAVSEEELKQFYAQNKEMMGGGLLGKSPGRAQDIPRPAKKTGSDPAIYSNSRSANRYPAEPGLGKKTKPPGP